MLSWSHRHANLSIWLCVQIVEYSDKQAPAFQPPAPYLPAVSRLKALCYSTAPTCVPGACPSLFLVTILSGCGRACCR